MAANDFTVRNILTLPVKPHAYVVHDPKLWEFGARIAPGGTRSWVVEYRPNGGGRKQPTKRVTIGRVASLSIRQGRDQAKAILAAVKLGADPARDRTDRREAETVAELAESYMDEEIKPLKKPSTARLYDGYFRVHVLPALGARKARDITRSDIARLHRKIGKGGQVTANRIAVLLSGLFSWAAKIGQVPEGFKNPAREISRFKEEGRERFLSADELGRLGDALREAETVGLPWDPIKPDSPRTVTSPFATAAIRLLLFTGARLREILHLTWANVDFDRNVLLLPDSKTGKKTVTLSAPALLVLETLPRFGAYVVAGNDPDRPRHDLHKPWKAIVKHAGLSGLRIHDLRHSFASVGVAGNHGLPILGKLLGHAAVETTQKYAHLADDPLKKAADSIAGTIAHALGEPLGAGSDVLPFEKSKR
jgi:integrase